MVTIKSQIFMRPPCRVRDLARLVLFMPAAFGIPGLLFEMLVQLCSVKKNEVEISQAFAIPQIRGDRMIGPTNKPGDPGAPDLQRRRRSVSTRCLTSRNS